MRILEKAPAKINLVLDTLYKRSDGFHEVEMIMTTVDLADRIEISPLKSDEIRIVSENRFVPNDHRNLAYQAARLIKNTYHIREGVEIYIEKQIPVAAGLAGGSSDAAAVLRGLNKLWDLELSLEELAVIGAEIGSDVSFCVYGGTALATGRGEKIKELPAPPSCWVILAKPTIGVSTQTVYQNLNLDKVEHPDVQRMIQALHDESYEGMCEEMGNVLEPITIQLHSEVEQIKSHMKDFGADAVLMSGSGPTVFGLTQQETRAQRIYNGLRGFCDEVYIVRMLGTRSLLD
ncbi:4-(cytidine 5'-diphospho)-2-C-methyl-D-erythritol kinase [Pontibacillus yanchengensis]|uniref:4-(Cytidine 5'-diphospho)-2-C-methyl-D-erythritol kinase n=2 Tax=Pontibacillus yanchengensis TaxID=462910 RepID=A0ACC7VLC5_9BACI|nr:4-(cytidine 5'-diphospho)-2-C-methyl-D-erythritol kinase [Pontibacillus yanchengensis]MYL35945.1 4-(cytidine 5'-diphospho)-2-C-methyl-D-erythritol kinase [Pontibacillus yanchengensis]MYL55793.1 4-(cytidine 5'-diphospho)-2-C-methyl-D-erythritol kinase [Pontibacillus yanchengensis]